MNLVYLHINRTMLERRFRRRRSLRSVLLFAVGFCSLFGCFSWYTLMCCRPNVYGEYIINNYRTLPTDSGLMDSNKHINDDDSGPKKAEELSGHQYKHSRKVDDTSKHQYNPSRKVDDPSGQQYRPPMQSPVPSGRPVNTLLTTSTFQRAMTSPSDGDHLLQPPDGNLVPTSFPQSIPPTLELDQYVVRAWLPRGIKERVESSSYESRTSKESGLDVLPATYATTTIGYGFGPPPKKRPVISPPVKRLPQALIIGVKKCGTRALLEFLRVHPDVRASGPETHFFDRHYQRGLEWYRQQMPTSLEGQITMEKTPSYFITKEVPPRIHSMSPSVRLLVVVRDPVTRAISDYTQSTSKRKDTPSFEDMAFLNVSTGLVDTSWSAIRIGVYARFLEWWTRYFSLDRILFISGENLIRDPAGEMGRVQDFLDLKQVISDKHFYFNETKGFPCLKKSEGSGNPHCLGKTKGRAHPDISLSTIQRLRDFYRPFNVKFYQMVGRNFGWP